MKIAVISSIIASGLLVAGVAGKSVMDSEIKEQVEAFNKSNNADLTYDTGFYNPITDSLTLSGVSEGKSKLDVETITLGNISNFGENDISINFENLVIPANFAIRKIKNEIAAQVVKNLQVDNKVFVDGDIDVAMLEGNGINITSSLNIDKLFNTGLDLQLNNFPMKPNLSNLEKMIGNKRYQNEILKNVQYEGGVRMETNGLLAQLKKAVIELQGLKHDDFIKKLEIAELQFKNNPNRNAFPLGNDFIVRLISATINDKDVDIDIKTKTKSTIIQTMNNVYRGKVFDSIEIKSETL